MFRPTLLLLALAAFLPAQQTYTPGPDSARQPGVPEGQITKHTWTSKIFPGTVRDYWVYVPAQYKPGQPAAVTVFQDGHNFVNLERAWKAPIVFDNLIHKGDMPVTIGVFVPPGVLPALDDSNQSRYNRSFEYDALGDRYARFLLEEILPEVAKDYTLTTDPNLRAIAGSSSGGIAAFTVAWQRPDAFRRVISFVGSYNNLRGGQIYPSLVRKHEPKPLRVFLQDGSADQNIYSGNWWINNQDMASALEYAGYDLKWVAGTEGHNSKHGSAILPDALRWLWHDWETPIQASTSGGQRHFVTEYLAPGEDWELVSEGHGFTEGPAIDKQGNFYFVDVRASRIFKIDPAGKQTVFAEETNRTSGLMWGPDDRLYAAQPGAERIVAYNPDGTYEVITKAASPNDLVVTSRRHIYYTDFRHERVMFVDENDHRRVAYEGLARPNGIIVSPDESLLIVADSWSKWAWSFQIQPDGSLANGQPFYRLETPDATDRSSADGMTATDDGHVLITSAEGLQICDQPGRVVGIIAKPQPGSLSNVVFGGPNLDTLYVTARDKVFRRKVRMKGVAPWAPVKPPRPGL